MRRSEAPADAAELDLAEVDRIVARTGSGPAHALPVLQAIQAHYRYLPEAALRRVCEITSIPPAALRGVATFYPQFRHRPMGRHTLCVCVGTACHVKGAERVHDAVARELGIEIGRASCRERV